MLYLRPSEIYYSQAQISAHFGRSTCHRYVPIGQTLDKLYDGTVKVDDIPKIRVCKKDGDGKWYTLDNRRLWLFRHLQGAGKCSMIPCEEVEYDSDLYSAKFSSGNGGVSVTFLGLGSPGGTRHSQITPSKPWS